MPQHALDYRRAGAVPPGYETTARAPVPADPAMLARREHLARQRAATPAAHGDRAAAALELRARQLRLLQLGGR